MAELTTKKKFGNCLDFSQFLALLASHRTFALQEDKEISINTER